MRFKIDPSDVSKSSTGFTAGRRRQASRAGRRVSETAATVTLSHKPTGVTVTGAVPTGHYSRQEMTQRRALLEQELLAKLLLEVAKHLRVSGR